MSLLVICEIPGYFLITFTAGDLYSLQNSENLLEPFQMQFSRKQKTFSQFFYAIYEIYVKF